MLKKSLAFITVATLGTLAHANDDLPYLSQSQFDSCLNSLRSNFVGRGVSGSTFDRYRPSVPDPSVIRSLNYQPEFQKEVWDYLSALVDSERVADGINAKNRNLSTLQRIENSYGVDMHHVLGVWGVESNFGQTLGKKPLFDSLATLSCFDRRQSYFRGEFANALKIVQNGDIYANDLTGSWAGAFGQTQFMPSTFLELAVDFDGDGRRDIVNSIPDSLASTANFLVKRGYRSGEPWGFEVKKPAGVWASSDRKTKKSMSHWRNLGYTLADGSPLPNTLASAGLLAPAGNNGPIFLVGKNFDVFYAYNASENYALAIAHLSDLIKKNQSQNTNFITSWPTDDAGIGRREAKEIQQALLNAGYDIGAVDGIIGDNTRRAIMDYQRKMGVEADGRAGQKFYRLIMSQKGSQTPTYSTPSYNQSSYNQSNYNQSSYNTPSYTQTPTTNTSQGSISWGNRQSGTATATTGSTGAVRQYRVVTNEQGQRIVVPVE